MTRADWIRASLAASGIAVLLLGLTTTTTLWDRDEPRFAQAAVEMLASGDYLLPTFNGELRPQKPPLIYWLMTFSLWALGQTEFAVRMWSPIAMAVAALATFAIGRRLWTPQVGLVAMIVFALTPLALVEGVAATTDAVLLASTTISIAIGSAALCRPPTWRDHLILGLAFGIGALVKGPVAIVLPAAIVALASWIARRDIAWTGRLSLLLVSASAIGIAIFAAWFVPAMLASAGQIATRGLVRENLGRLLEPMDGHGTPLALAPFYYPAVIAFGFIPWVVYLPAAIRRIIAGRSWASPRGALLVTWTAVPLAAMTLSATKLPHYIFPLWPALALSVGIVLVERGRTFAPGSSVRRLLVAATSVAIGVGFGLVPLLERYKPVPGVMASVRQSAIPGPLFVYAFEEPSLAFYGRRPLVRLEGEAALASWARLPGDALLVAPRSAIASVEGTRGALGLHELAARRGWNYVKGGRFELVAFARRSDR